MNAIIALSSLWPSPGPGAPPPHPAPRRQKPAPDGPVVVLETTLGTIRSASTRTRRPISVDNFLKYVRAGHYDGTIFHRVIPGFMIQGGGFTPDMKEKADARRRSGTRRGTACATRGARWPWPAPNDAQQRHRAVLHQREGQPPPRLRDRRRRLRGLRRGHRGHGRGGQDRRRAHHARKGRHEDVPVTPVADQGAVRVEVRAAPHHRRPRTRRPKPARPRRAGLDARRGASY